MMNRALMQRQMFSKGGEAERASPPSYMYSPTELRSVVEKFPDIYTGPKAIPLREMPSEVLIQIVASDASSSDEIMDATLELERRGFDRSRDIPMVTGRNYGAPGGAEGEPQRAVYARDPNMPIFNRGYIERLEQQRAGTRNVAASEDIPFEDRYFEPAEFRYGGDVKKMQMGGEPMAAPSATPADMSGIAGMLSQAEQSTAQGTQQMGAEYAQNMMAGIEGAEDFKTMIDSIRGNDMPMQARYEELASYVGPQDAQQTPESVLAMVQPTIMMTEEGAMGSGIGELMQGITGSVEMETAGGQPTAMGQGVGSMLMAGAQEPVQAFRYGGVVQKFNVGGVASANDPALHEAFYAANDLKPGFGGQTPLPGATPQKLPTLPTRPAVPSLESLYEKNLPMYQKILGRDKSAEDMSKANVLFDISRRALAFAGGVSPDTGESIADRSTASQLAAVTQTLPVTVQAEMAEKAKMDQAIKLGALEAAQGTRKSLLDASLETFELGEGQVRYDAYGNVIAKGPEKGPEYTNVPEGGTLFKDGVKVGSGKPKPKKLEIGYVVVDGVTQTTFNKNDPDEVAAAEAMIAQASQEGREAYLDKTRPTSEATERLKRSIINSNLLDRIENGSATEDDISLWLTNVQDYTRPETVEQKTSTGNTVTIKKASRGLPPRTEKVLKDKFPDIHARIFSEPSVFTDRRVHVPGEPNPEGSADIAMNIDRIAYELGMTVYQPLNQSGVFPLRIQQTFKEFDYSKAAGFEGAYTTVLDTFTDFFTDELADDGEAARAKAAVAGLKVDLEALAAASYPGGRAPVQFLEQFRLIQPQFGQLLVGNAQNLALMEKLTQVLGEMEIRSMQNAYGNYDSDIKQQGIQNLNQIRPVLAKAQVIKRSLEKSVGKLGGDVESILLEASSSSKESLLDKYDLNKNSNSRTSKKGR